MPINFNAVEIGAAPGNPGNRPLAPLQENRFPFTAHLAIIETFLIEGIHKLLRICVMRITGKTPAEEIYDHPGADQMLNLRSDSLRLWSSLAAWRVNKGR